MLTAEGVATSPCKRTSTASSRLAPALLQNCRARGAALQSRGQLCGQRMAPRRPHTAESRHVDWNMCAAPHWNGRRGSPTLRLPCLCHTHRRQAPWLETLHKRARTVVIPNFNARRAQRRCQRLEDMMPGSFATSYLCKCVLMLTRNRILGAGCAQDAILDQQQQPFAEVRQGLSGRAARHPALAGPPSVMCFSLWHSACRPCCCYPS